MQNDGRFTHPVYNEQAQWEEKKETVTVLICTDCTKRDVCKYSDGLIEYGKSVPKPPGDFGVKLHCPYKITQSMVILD